MLTEAARFSGSEFDIRLQTPDARNLASLGDLTLTRAASLDVSGRLNIDKEKLLIDGLRVELDEQLLTASGSIDTGDGPAGVDISARVQGADLARVASLLLAGEDASVVPELLSDAACHGEADRQGDAHRPRGGMQQLVAAGL